MWMPTHVQVTVQRASGLLIKGKNKNDCFVTIALGKTKYQTSIKENATADVEWHEECELPIPDQGNTAEIILTVLHHNTIGMDEFLGRVAIPLNSLEMYERPKNKWFKLESKPGKEKKSKERGQLEVKISFFVKSGSLTDLSKKEKHKSSVGQLSHAAQSIGGSLLSLGSVEKRKGIKKFAKSIGSKMHLKSSKKKINDGDDNSSFGSVGSFKKSSNNLNKLNNSRQTREDADPGVVSEDDDEFTFDDLSHKSSVSSLNQPSTQMLDMSTRSVDNIPVEVPIKASPPIKPPRIEVKQQHQQQQQDEWESKLFGNKSKNLLKVNGNDNHHRRSWDSSKLASQIEEEEPLEIRKLSIGDNVVNKSSDIIVNKKEEKESVFTKLKNFRKDKIEVVDSRRVDKTTNNFSDRIIIGGVNDHFNNTYNNHHISNELLQKFEGKSREDLILLICDLQHDLEFQKKKNKDLEDYLDDLLLRVMETTPRILQNPYVTCKYKKLSG